MGASIVAVVGTIVGGALGAVLGFVFERRNAVDASRRARAETLRQERSTAYAQFAGALGVYRRAQIDRWDTNSTDTGVAADALGEARRQRDAAREAMFRVQLLAGTRSVREGAQAAFNAMDISSDERRGRQGCT